MYMAATHTKTFRPVNMVSPIFSHYLTLRSPRQTTSPAASTSYGQQGRQTGQNCLLGCGSWARAPGSQPALITLSRVKPPPANAQIALKQPSDLRMRSAHAPGEFSRHLGFDLFGSLNIA